EWPARSSCAATARKIRSLAWRKPPDDIEPEDGCSNGAQRALIAARFLTINCDKFTGALAVLGPLFINCRRLDALSGVYITAETGETPVASNAPVFAKQANAEAA